MNSVVEVKNTGKVQLGKKENLSHQPLMVEKKSVDGPYAKYVLFVLMLVSLFNFIDRQILSILAEDIKADLGLSDGDIGFLYGTAFAVFYAIFGIPLARLADSWQRKKLISIGLGFWSLMTALSGTARGFLPLALCRFGVGIGEASATPAATSLLYDYFSPKIRTTVLAVFNSGVYIGMGVGLFLGGAILDAWNNAWPDTSIAPFGLKGWQAAFMGVGLPGILLACWVATLKEPPRGLGDGLVVSGVASAKFEHPLNILKTEMLPLLPLVNLWALRKEGASVKAIWFNMGVGASCILLAVWLIHITGESLQWSALAIGFYCAFSWVQSLICRDPVCFGLIFKCKSLCFLYVAIGFSVFTSYAIIFWSIPYFQRYHGIEASKVGSTIGLFMAVGGLIGVILGGVLGDWLRHHTKHAKPYICLVGWLLALLAAFCMLAVENVSTAYLCSFIFFLTIPLGQAPIVSTINDLMIPRTRAIGTAMNIMISTFMGFALGPYVVGLTSDAFIASGVESGESLRQGLLAVLTMQVIGIFFLLLTIKHIVPDEDSRLDRARELGERI